MTKKKKAALIGLLAAIVMLIEAVMEVLKVFG